MRLKKNKFFHYRKMHVYASINEAYNGALN